MNENKIVNMRGKVVHWVKHFMARRQIQEYKIVDDNIDTLENAGYLSDINLVTVSYTTKGNKQEILNLVIKHDLYKNTSLIALAFTIETHIYSAVFPTFTNFLESKHLPNPHIIPQYYDSFTDDGTNVIITENIVKLGYKLSDRLACADMRHCRVLMQAYAKFHALSFALRHQQPDKFKELITAEEFYGPYIEKEQSNIQKDIVNFSTFLKRKGDEELAGKLEREMADRFNGTLTFNHEKEEQIVFSHGDNWNNNHMFLYDEEDPSTPTSVMLLDWQLGCLRSPAFDLALLLFLVCSKNELDQLEYLLETYHKFLTDYIKQLGSSEDLFTFEDLKRHWKQYSIFGVVVMIVDLKIVVNNDFYKGFNFSESAEEIYYQRAKPVLATYFKYKELF